MKAVFALICLTACSSLPLSARAAEVFVPCQQDQPRYEARSKELQALVEADQKDRQGTYDSLDWTKIPFRDEARRKRVSEIFAEGCFKSPADYAVAALVFQHGNVPDHYYQTFIWSKKAVELGDEKQKQLMANAIDRYLVNIGHKQLFGTQASRPDTSNCFCLEPVEMSFSARERAKYHAKTLQQSLDWVGTLNAPSAKCAAAEFCPTNLRATPKGTLVGFW